MNTEDMLDKLKLAAERMQLVADTLFSLELYPYLDRIVEEGRGVTELELLNRYGSTMGRAACIYLRNTLDGTSEPKVVLHYTDLAFSTAIELRNSCPNMDWCLPDVECIVGTLLEKKYPNFRVTR